MDTHTDIYIYIHIYIDSLLIISIFVITNFQYPFNNILLQKCHTTIWYVGPNKTGPWKRILFNFAHTEEIITLSDTSRTPFIQTTSKKVCNYFVLFISH